jgi:hypothetical protein
VQTFERVEAAEKHGAIEDAQVVDHRESHEGIDVTVAAASQPMISDTEQTGQNSGSANEHFWKQGATFRPPGFLGLMCMMCIFLFRPPGFLGLTYL